MKKVLGAILPLLLSFLIAEGLLRFLGYSPEISVRTGTLNGIYEEDAVTGWRSADTFRNPDARHVIWKGGRRASAAEDPLLQGSSYRADAASGQKHLVFLGGSFTQGADIPDEDTLAWLVQERVPELVVTNFATGGQGTCQSYLRMKDLIENHGFQGVRFIYGFLPAHEPRNVAHPLYAWRVARASTFRTAFMPYCWLDESNKLIVKPPETFDFIMPMSEKLALSRLLEEFYYFMKGRFYEKRQREVTERVLLAMQELAESTNSDFTVLSMRFADAHTAHYQPFFEKHSFEFIDGTHPDQNESSMQLADTHPNAKMNLFWVEKITEKLFSRASSSQAPE